MKETHVIYRVGNFEMTIEQGNDVRDLPESQERRVAALTSWLVSVWERERKEAC